METATNLTSFYAQTRHETSRPDIIILDMTIGVHGSSRGKEEAAGIEIMQAILSRGLDTKVIVATQHDQFQWRHRLIESVEQLESLLQEAFPQQMQGLVRVDLADTVWEERLVTLFERCRKCI